MKKLRIIPLLLAILLLTGCSAKQENDAGGIGVIHITNQIFDSAVLNSEKTVLLDFYADWCGPCQQMAPFLDEIAAENPDIMVGKINVDYEPVLSDRFKIEAMPTLVVIKDGQEVRRFVGYQTKDEILGMLK